MTRAFLSLGSNLGDRAAYLRDAVAALEGTGELVACSAVYETEPIGGPEDQGAFLNLVVELRTAKEPLELLAACQELEQAARRERLVHHGPRTLDVDVLTYADAVSDDPVLTLPHPRMRERRFVLVPLAELAPELVEPAWLEAAVGDLERLGMLSDVS